MKIVIAAWHLKNFNVGLGRYARELINAIGRVDQGNEYVILMPDETVLFPARPNVEYRVIRFPVFRRRFWEQVVPLLVGRYDLLHFPYDSAVAWGRGKFVVTIHDVKPLIFRELGSRRSLNSIIRHWLVGDKWAKIAHVITVSNCSRRDIIARLPVPADRVTVVYQGVDSVRFRPIEAKNETNSTSALTSTLPRRRPYILCVAGADPTKNVSTLVKAFARLPMRLKASYDLVLAGDFWHRSEVRALVANLGLKQQVVFPGIVSDDRLVTLYQQASLFVFPSRYEGFGLPVLEAMACGCPVVSSGASSLPEVAGDAALLVEPTDVEGFARAMEKVLSDAGLSRDLRERGLCQAARFTWDRTARETIAVYERAAG